MANKTSYVLKKQLYSPNMNRQAKCMLYKTLTRPILTYESDCPLTKDRNMLIIFERKVWRIIYGPFNDIGIWRKRYDREHYKLCDELDAVKVLKIGILRWLGHLFRIHELDPYRKLTVLKPEGTRLGKPKVKWLGPVEKDLKNMDVRNWRRK